MILSSLIKTKLLMLAAYCIVYLLNFIDIASVGGVLEEEEKSDAYCRILSTYK